MALNGILAGLVGITAGADQMSILGAVIAGGVAGTIVVFAIIMFDRIKLVMGVRVDEQEEIEGLDVAEHGVPAYGVEHAEF
jgi:ammonia channel protein AmtB